MAGPEGRGLRPQERHPVQNPAEPAGVRLQSVGGGHEAGGGPGPRRALHRPRGRGASRRSRQLRGTQRARQLTAASKITQTVNVDITSSIGVAFGREHPEFLY